MYVECPKGTSAGATFKSAEDFSQWLIKDRLISTVPWDDAGNFVRFSATFVAKTPEAEKRVLELVRERLSAVKFVF
jgi:LL-diaminopimelate aminotransferase